MNFAELIAPTSRAEFLSDYWEKAFLHGGAVSGAYTDYFSYRDIERWIRSTKDGFFFVLHPEGETVRIESHQASSVAPRTVSNNYENGFAQILKMVGDWPSLQGLVSHLEGTFHTKVHVNVFLTPEGTRSHPTYTCNDNVFVLQVEGEEVWQLRELTVIQHDLTEKWHLEFPEEWMGRHQNRVVSEIRLRPGELLYIPRGMPHFAKAPENGMGLHLRVYVNSLTWVDFFKMAVEHAAVHSQDLRRSLPPGFVENDNLGAPMATNFRRLMDEFQSVPFDQVLSAMRRNRVSHQGFPPDDFLGTRTRPEDLTLDSEVERRPDVLCTVEEIRDTVRRPRCALFFGDHQVNGPPSLLRAFEFIRDHKSFSVSDIPGLDEKGQLVLVRRLLSEGLLRSLG